MPDPILAFAPAAALLTVTPGLDTALVLRTAAVEGRGPALRAGLGIVAGLFGWGLLVAAGLGALLAASELAYAVLRWVGAGYLLYLGAGLLLSPRRALAANDAAPPSARPARRWLLRGFLTNILNPKVGVFYVSFLPQFIPAGANVPLLTVALTAIHGLLTLLWFAALVLATRPLGRVLSRPSVVLWLDRLTGGLFLAFGARLALAAPR